MSLYRELRPDPASLPIEIARTSLEQSRRALTRPFGQAIVTNGAGGTSILGTGGGDGLIPWVDDSEPPSRPTGLSAASISQVITVHWDGTLEYGLPADFHSIEIHIQPDGGDDTVIGALRIAGDVASGLLTEGDIVDVWAIALDDAHDRVGEWTPNRSEASDVITLVVEPVVSQGQLRDKADEILSGVPGEVDKHTAAIRDDLDAAKTLIEANTTSIGAVKSGVEQAQRDLLEQSTRLDNAQQRADAAQTTASNAAATAQGASAAAQGAQTTADSKNKSFVQASEPAHAGLVPGDLWLQTGAGTDAERVRRVKVWNGSKFVEQTLYAQHLLVPGSIVAGQLAADALYGGHVKGGVFETTDGRLLINDAGLVLTDADGEATVTMRTDTGDVLIRGAVHAGGSILGATVTGCLLQTNAAERVGVKMSDGGLIAYNTDHDVTFALDADGNILMDGAVLANTSLSAPEITGGRVTGASIVTGDDPDNRAEMDSNGFRVIKDGVTLIAFDVSEGIDLGSSGIATDARVNELETDVRDGYTPLQTFEQTTGALSDTMSNMQSQVDAQNSQLTAEINERRQYMRFDPDTGLTIGDLTDKAAYAVNLTSTALQFLAGDTVAAYVTNDRLYITNAQVVNTLRIGNFAFLPRANGHMSLQYIGGDITQQEA